MTNTKTTTTTTKLSAILEDSKKASVVSCKTLHAKSGDHKFFNYKVSILADNKEDQDAQDILQESRLSILENEKNEDRFVLACKAINKYVYAQNKQQSNRTKHTTLYNTLQRIKKAIEDPEYYNNIGDKAKNTIINAMIEYNISFFQDDENILKLESLIAEEKTKAEKIPSNTLYIDDPNTGDIINVNNEINNLINKMDNNDIINNITALLTPTQKKILKYIAYGYTNITIAKKLNLNKSTITRHIQAIQKKALVLYPNGIDNII